MKKILLLIFILVFLFIFFFVRPYFTFVTQTLHISLLRTIFPGKTLKMTNNQVNILILGIGGDNHEGPNLSDSITLAIYDKTTNQLTTIGIPRDIWSEPLRDRINSAYAYGVAKQDEKSGLTLAKAAVENILGYPIHYAVVINFTKFEGLIDHVGGVDIDVPRSFIDKKFPIPGKENDDCNDDKELACRYETVTFEKGQQRMDGKRALTFVRSRQATNDEGSDFARNNRQQLVLSALKNKVTDIFMSRDLHTMTDLYNKIDKSIIRDIGNQEVAILLKTIVLEKNFTQKSTFLPEELFEVPDAYNYEGKYVLIQKNNDQLFIKNYLTCILTKEETLCLPLQE